MKMMNSVHKISYDDANNDELLNLAIDNLKNDIAIKKKDFKTYINENKKNELNQFKKSLTSNVSEKKIFKKKNSIKKEIKKQSSSVLKINFLNYIKKYNQNSRFKKKEKSFPLFDLKQVKASIEEDLLKNDFLNRLQKCVEDFNNQEKYLEEAVGKINFFYVIS